MNTDNRTGPGSINRLYRNPRRGKVFGVCAGLADYFGFDLTVTRVLVVIGALFSFPIVCVAYLVLGFLLPRKPDEGSGGRLRPRAEASSLGSARHAVERALSFS